MIDLSSVIISNARINVYKEKLKGYFSEMEEGNDVFDYADKDFSKWLMVRGGIAGKLNVSKTDVEGVFKVEGVKPATNSPQFPVCKHCGGGICRNMCAQ